MKNIKLHHIIAWLLLAIVGFIVLHAPLTVYLGVKIPSINQIIKAWKEILLALAAVLLVIEYFRLKAWELVKKDKLIWAMCIFIAIHIIITLFYNLPSLAEDAGLMIDLRFIVYFMAVYMFLKIHPSYKDSFIKIVKIGALIVVGFATLQLILPHNFLVYFGYGPNTIEPFMTIDKNPDFVRFGSTLRGPNPLGAYAVMVLSVILAYVCANYQKLKNRKIFGFVLFFTIGGMVSLLVSYSRSAWIAMIVATLIIIIYKYRKYINIKTTTFSLIIIIVSFGLVYLMRGSYLVSNVLLHNNPTTGAVVDSNKAHATSLTDGIMRATANPFGAGVGSTGSASLLTDKPIIIENQYLFIAHEVGWLGLVIFFVINYLVLNKLWHRRQDYLNLALFASGIGLFVIGLMLPVWVDDTVSIIWWGLSAVAIASIGGESYGKSNKKAKRTT